MRGAKALPAVLGIAGYSGSGKTTLIEALLPLLREQGLRVATIKHSIHAPASLDTEGSDTWRHRQAGSESTVLTRPGLMAVYDYSRQDPSLEDALDMVRADVDLVLVEGYKRASIPKVMLAATEADGLAAAAAQPDSVLAVAVAVDIPQRFEGPVVVTTRDDVKGLGELIIGWLGAASHSHEAPQDCSDERPVGE